MAVVAWLGAMVEDGKDNEVMDWLSSELGFNGCTFVDKFVDSNGLHIYMFNVPESEVSRFAVFRLGTNDMKWLCDYLVNFKSSTPTEILEKYKDYANEEYVHDDSMDTFHNEDEDEDDYEDEDEDEDDYYDEDAYPCEGYYDDDDEYDEY